MPITEPTKLILSNTVKEWAKFATERDKLTGIANEVCSLTRKVVQECLAFMKAQNVDVTCDTPETLKVLGVTIHINTLIEATFPNVKASVVLKCGSATRAIIVNSNMTISAGGIVVQFEQLKKAIPDPFATNAADFVRDAFLYAARTGGKEEAEGK